jgi:BirA family biotin operon repressor/biotin-[acetyl-CoA-carboxylase] ligase
VFDRGMYGDLDRPPLRTAALERALAPDGWRVEVEASVASTNQVVADRARQGEPHGLVVIAEEQTQGRGRLDRTWVSPPRAGLTMSLLIRPDLPPERLGWVSLLAGAGVAQALRRQCEVSAELKWPNDVLIGGRKVCGLLAEAVGDAVVLGVGLNVTTKREELPVPESTSLALEGAVVTDRDTIAKALLRSISDALGDRTFSAYRELCSTLGREVRVELPGGRSVEGTADAVDDEGRLVVNGTPYAAGDVVHLR